MNYAGLIFDDSNHYLDHLGPYCSLKNWPLILCEPALADLAKRYYPDLLIIEASHSTIPWPDVLVTCDTQPLLKAAFPHQKIKTLWLPHGNSDKGINSPFFEALQGEETALVYGQKMIDLIRSKGIFLNTIPVGNFRLDYFVKHQHFYKQKTKELFLPDDKKKYLYAPTWEDEENNGSFWDTFPLLAQNLPKDSSLIIKLHPNTFRKYEIELHVLAGQYKTQTNIFFLPEFPPIYALLEVCDAYIGDMSSIGYDFLIFDRPMYFINAQGPLSRCGYHLPLDKIFSSQEKKGEFSLIRKQTYEAAFSLGAKRWQDKKALQII